MKTSKERDDLENISVNDDVEEESELLTEETIDQEITDNKDIYKFGWSGYSEITNGRFAMIGFLAIILIEFLSKHSFLKWAGIL